jgi:hypothetical protein
VCTFRRMNEWGAALYAPQHSLTRCRKKPYNPKVCLNSQCPIPSPAIRHFVTPCDASQAGSSSPQG